MKKILFLLLLTSFQLTAQKTGDFNLNDAERTFLTDESESSHIYLIDSPRILIAFNKSSFSFLIDNTTYTFFTNFYADDAHKFKIRDGIDNIVGYGLMSGDKDYEVVLHFDNTELTKKFKANLIKFSTKNEIFNKASSVATGR